MTLTLKPNTYRKTRDGRKAEVVGQRSEAGGKRPWIGVIGGTALCAWDEFSGEQLWPQSKPSPADLIEEWREPVSRTFDVVWCFDGKRHHVHEIEMHGGLLCGNKIISRGKLTLTEGEGLTP